MADADPIQLLVITPERQVIDTTAQAVVIPAHDGELGILRDRAPLMCELGIGRLRYTQAGQEHGVFIDGGFAQLYHNRVIVLTTRALPAELVTSEIVTAAERAAEKPAKTPEELVERERAQQRASVLRGVR